MHDVFISYSVKDKNVADAICTAFEVNGIRCWIAPRDIKPGNEWAEAIIDAISGCKAMVVVFSSSSNNSKQVLREVERAVNKGVPIVPFRIEDIQPSKSMEYYLSIPHWLDALTEPMEVHIRQLVGTIMSLLGKDYIDSLDPPSFSGVSPKEAAPRSANINNHEVSSINTGELDELRDVEVPIRAVVGRTLKAIKDILEFAVGSVIELDKNADEPLELYAFDKVFAKGEVVVIDDDYFGIKITECVGSNFAGNIANKQGVANNYELTNNLQEKGKIESNTDINLIMDVPLTVEAELGSTKMNIAELMKLCQGDIIKFKDAHADEPINILVNNRYLAKAEVVVIDESFGVRLTDIVHRTKIL